MLVLTIARPGKKDREISFSDQDDLDSYLYNDFRNGMGISNEEIVELFAKKTLRLSQFITLRLSEVQK